MSRRKVKKKNLGKLITFLVLVILAIGVFFSYKYYFKDTKDNINNDKVEEKNPEPEEIKEPQDEVYKLKFLATGDALIHSVIFRSYQNKSTGAYDFTDALNPLSDIVKNYDIAYYNQEVPMGDNSLPYAPYPRFYIPGEFGDAMQAIGFNTASLASNHSLDVGEKGMLNTLKYFKATDMLYNGISETEEERNTFMIKEKNNITYTLLSYTTLTNGLSTPKGKSYMLNKYNAERVKKDIESVRDKVDVLIVAMHWGTEYVSKPVKEQLEIAEYLASLGVDIVVGNHSHVLQPITKIDDTIVMYSLGNFISNQYGKEDWNRNTGFLATLDITKTVHPDGTSEIVYDNLGGELIFTKYKGHPTATSNHTDHQVIPFSKMYEGFKLNESITDKTQNDYKRVYDKYVGILESMGTDLNVVPYGV